MIKKILLVLIASVLYVLVGTLSLIKIREVEIPIIATESLTLTDYYQQDLYAQCRGLEYFKVMIEENKTLELNSNFNKEYQKTLAYIELDKKELGLTLFKCP